jgi:hypothetical protein
MSDKDFIHEVNEDVRADKLLKLWRQYSNYFYAFVIAVLVAVGGTSLYKNYRLNQSMAMSDQYSQALELLVKHKYDEGLKALEALEASATQSTIGYAVMAKLQRASFFLNQQKETDKPSEDALKIYWEISSNTKFPSIYQNIGTYLTAFHSLGQTYESINKEELLKRLKKMSEKNTTYRLLALELLAHYYSLDGKAAEARKACESVLSDANDPDSSVGERCTALMETLPQQEAESATTEPSSN